MRSFLRKPLPRWQIALEMLALGFVLAIVCGAALIYTGAYDVAATHRHWPFTEWVLDTARIRSIKSHAAGPEAPPGLDDPAKLVMGVEHFAAHCAVCHGAPGVPKGDITKGLYPPSPDLAVTSTRYTEAELFWIIKHGIKMTGMPAWADHSDEELWATVAFIRKLPGMTAEEYGKLVMASMTQDGHHHDGHKTEPGATVADPPRAPAHDNAAGHRH
jgi:mono/diheme cytochrome c family protein